MNGWNSGGIVASHTEKKNKNVDIPPILTPIPVIRVIPPMKSIPIYIKSTIPPSSNNNASGPLKINAKGIKRDQPPIKFEKIFLEFILNSKNTMESDIQKAIQIAEDSACPVWQMVKNNVEVITEYKINASH